MIATATEPVTGADLARAQRAHLKDRAKSDATTARRDDLVRRAAAEGWQNNEIAERLGCHPSRVGQILKPRSGKVP